MSDSNKTASSKPGAIHRLLIKIIGTLLMDILFRDPIWQFIGVAISALAVGLTLFLFLIGRRKKELSYEILSRTPILTETEELEGKLQVLYDGIPAKSLDLIVIKLANSGKTPILSSEIVSPVRFYSGEKSQILSVGFIDSNPKDLFCTLVIREENVELSRTLLNAGDNITFKLLIAGARPDIYANGRIVGISKIFEKVKSSVLRDFFLVISLGLVVAFTFLALTMAHTGGLTPEKIAAAISFFIVFVSGGWLARVIIFRGSEKRANKNNFWNN